MSQVLYSFVFFAILFLSTSATKVSEGLKEIPTGYSISLQKTPHEHDSDYITYMTQIQDNIGSFKNCN